MRVLYLMNDQPDTVCADIREILETHGPDTRIIIGSRSDANTLAQYELVKRSPDIASNTFYALLEDRDFNEFVPPIGTNERLLKLVSSYHVIYVAGEVLTGALVGADFKVNENNSALRVYAKEDAKITGGRSA